MTDEESIIRRRVTTSETNYKRLVKLCNSLVTENELDSNLKTAMEVEFASYQALLVKLQLQQNMNLREIERYRAEEESIGIKTQSLLAKTQELKEQLEIAQKLRAEKEEYARQIDQMTKPKKIQVEKKLLEDDPENPKEQEDTEKELEDNAMITEVQAESNISEGASPSETSTPLDRANSNSERLVTPVPAPTVPMIAILNLSRIDAIKQNSALREEIGELENLKSVYADTWDQRKLNFQEILDALQRFRSQILEEKMEQERREALDDDERREGERPEIELPSRNLSPDEDRMDTS